MECTDIYGGQTRALPGLCTWGYCTHTRAARSFKQSPCLLDEKNNGCTTPRRMLVRRSSKYSAKTTERGGVEHVVVGETHEIAYVDQGSESMHQGIFRGFDRV
jgi:hypothetical protein